MVVEAFADGDWVEFFVSSPATRFVIRFDVGILASVIFETRFVDDVGPRLDDRLGGMPLADASLSAIDELDSRFKTREGNAFAASVRRILGSFGVSNTTSALSARGADSESAPCSVVEPSDLLFRALMLCARC